MNLVGHIKHREQEIEMKKPSHKINKVIYFTLCFL
jgi:hypothetical protein